MDFLGRPCSARPVVMTRHEQGDAVMEGRVWAVTGKRVWSATLGARRDESHFSPKKKPPPGGGVDDANMDRGRS